MLLSSLLFVGCSNSSDENTSTSTESKTAMESTTSTETKEEAEVSYQYYSAEEVKSMVEKKEDMILLDIQVEEEFNEHHIEGAVATYAYPVKTDEDRAKLDAVLPDLESSKAPIVVICPGGAGGATRTIDYLTTKGIDPARLFILEKGQGGWPYDELLAK